MNDNATHLVCKRCHVSCLTCHLPADPVACLDCNPAQISYRFFQPLSQITLPGDNASVSSGSCQSSCKSGFSLDKSQLPEYICVSCFKTCRECTEPQNESRCSLCPPQTYKYFQALDTLKTYGLCLSKCPYGFSPTSAYDPQVSATMFFCHPCDPSCEDCSEPQNAGRCLKCASGQKAKYMQPFGETETRRLYGQCVDSCSAGQYVNDTVFPFNVCRPCIENCLTCWNSRQCAECSSGYYLLNDLCVNKTSCPAEMYPNSAIRPNQCSRCQLDNCKGCDETGTRCLQCDFQYEVNQNGQCKFVFACLIENCLACDSSFKYCKTCKNSFILSADRTQCNPCQLPRCELCRWNP